jgi:hypothetical protein
MVEDDLRGPQDSLKIRTEEEVKNHLFELELLAVSIILAANLWHWFLQHIEGILPCKEVFHHDPHQ